MLYCMFCNFYLAVLWSLLVNAASNTSQIQQWNTQKRCGNFSKLLTMKTSEECQCFLMTPCQWGCSVRYSCTWISFNTYLSIIYFIWWTVRYTMRQTCVPPNILRSTKLWDTQHSPELAFEHRLSCTRKPNFSSPVNH